MPGRDAVRHPLKLKDDDQADDREDDDHDEKDIARGKITSPASEAVITSCPLSSS
jgi:hypothetical protein